MPRDQILNEIKKEYIQIIFVHLEDFNIKDFICEICNKYFISKDEKKMHICSI